ncbi:hypothetical protein HZB60_12155 [candidate division KSB1 bacterium]|nr:hypothetical protein [candidate division KSB1 bacterium]
MRIRILTRLSLLLLMTVPALSLDFYLDPDTLQASAGQEVTLSARITASDLLRSFTVYLAYDTNVIDLIPPLLPGPLVAGHSGLQFDYFDHAPMHPTLLEVTATIIGSDLWQGPGELFQLTLATRTCGDAVMTAPFAPIFLDGGGNAVPVAFAGAIVGVCPRVPQPASNLTCYQNLGPTVILRWHEVLLDTLQRPLWSAPIYRVLGQQMLPVPEPEVVLTETADTVASNTIGMDGQSWNYRVIVLTP